MSAEGGLKTKVCWCRSPLPVFVILSGERNDGDGDGAFLGDSVGVVLVSSVLFQGRLAMSDIVERLRDWSEGPDTWKLTDEAADEIERLQKAHDHQYEMAGLMLREAERLLNWQRRAAEAMSNTPELQRDRHSIHCNWMAKRHGVCNCGLTGFRALLAEAQRHE